MAGKMAPRPSSPLSRSSIQFSARRVARSRMRAGIKGSIKRPSRSAARNTLARKTLAPEVIALLFGRRGEQLADVHVARVLGHRLARAQNEQRHHDGARPIRHLVEMERKPSRQQHDFDGNIGHAAPRDLREQCQRNPGEHIDPGGAALPQDCRARPRHVRRVRAVAGQLQRVVGLDRATQIEVAAMIERPAAVLGLSGAQVAAELCLERGVDLVQEVHHHDVLGRDRAVRLELEQPVSLFILPRNQRIAGIRDRAIQRRIRYAPQLVRRAMSPRAIAARIRLRCRVGSRLRCDAAHDPEFP